MNNKNMHHSTTEFSLFVGDLPHDCADDKLQRLFQQKFKSVKRVQIIRNDDGSSRGFGFIRFEDKADFQAALSQEMKIGNVTLRLDKAHVRENRYTNRSRYNSFNSTGNNNNNHNHHFNSGGNSHHHHNQHHHHHQSQQHHGGSQHQNQNKSIQSESVTGASGHQQSQSQPHQQQLQHNTQPGVGNNNNAHHPTVVGVAGIGHHHPVHQAQGPQQEQQHSLHNTLSNHNHYNTTQHQQLLSNQQQTTTDNKNLKQPIQIGTEGSNQQSQNSTQSQQPLTQPTPQHNLQQVNNSSTSTPPTTNTSSHSSAILNNHTLSANHQAAATPAIGPDLRNYAATSMMDTHVLTNTDQPSLMPPTSVYGHLYPYGPPFSYIHPPQPNPVIPISAVPPAPPNQASPSSVVNQQHSHSITASNTSRYSSGQHQTHQHHPHQHHHHHHHQQQQQQQQQPHTVDGGINAMPGGVQASHQGPPLYYYYHPSPVYFDQTGGTAGPPSIYHTQPFHPQFFTMPPAYMPNAHTFNQLQPQPPTASQSDATVINQQQPHQQQVNMRTRDIDTTIE